MGYSMIALVASVILGVRHVFDSEASRTSRLFVAIVVLASLVLWRYYPRWLVVAILMQAGVGVYVLVYGKVTNS